MIIKHKHYNLTLSYFVWVFLSAFVLVLLGDPAFAWSPSSSAASAGARGVGSGVGDGLCLIALAFQGEIAAGIATIAVCTIGALACVGRVQWTTAILVGTGIAVLFGAHALITLTTNLATAC